MRRFFHMTCEIGEEMDRETSVITLTATDSDTPPRVLDIGMAPGGFTKTMLRSHRDVKIRGIILPLELGGLEVMLPRWKTDSKIFLEFLDVTMLAEEMGRSIKSIPTKHTDVARFSSKRPYQGEIFDLVFCGATAQRAHARADYRESSERLQLVTSQLILALQRLRDHGSLVLVLHKPEAFNTADVIRTFTRFSSVSLFKPGKKHAIRSSFYMVATKVETQSKEMQASIVKWKKQWENVTFQSDDALSTCSRVSEDQACEMLAEFGPQLISLATSVRKIQADALRSAPFIKGLKSTMARDLASKTGCIE
jgi:23S rRNA U2552 (ribose-2'-O)-methylase RlmE/FtsJ